MAIIHKLAAESQAIVNWRNKAWEANKFNQDCTDNTPCKLPIPCNKAASVCYPIVSERYMWGCGWNYDLPKDFPFDGEEHVRFCCVIDDVIEGLHCLYKKTPLNSVLREIIWHVRREAKCYRKWLRESRRFCGRQGPVAPIGVNPYKNNQGPIGQPEGQVYCPQPAGGCGPSCQPQAPFQLNLKFSLKPNYL